MQWNINTIAQVIDVSVAPVFLLAGISGLLMVLTNRLARTIDRSRSLQAAITSQELPEHQDTFNREMASLLKRSRFINRVVYLARYDGYRIPQMIWDKAQPAGNGMSFSRVATRC